MTPRDKARLAEIQRDLDAFFEGIETMFNEWKPFDRHHLNRAVDAIRDLDNLRVALGVPEDLADFTQAVKMEIGERCFGIRQPLYIHPLTDTAVAAPPSWLAAKQFTVRNDGSAQVRGE